MFREKTSTVTPHAKPRRNITSSRHSTENSTDATTIRRFFSASQKRELPTPPDFGYNFFSKGWMRNCWPATHSWADTKGEARQRVATDCARSDGRLKLGGKNPLIRETGVGSLTRRSEILVPSILRTAENASNILRFTWFKFEKKSVKRLHSGVEMYWKIEEKGGVRRRKSKSSLSWQKKRIISKNRH